MLDNLKGKSKEEQERIKRELNDKQKASEQLLKDKEDEIARAKQEQEKITKKKQDEM
jgi:hypothetical protein